jgi:two-component system, chemotaxis family, chemotaxis protein CheY
LAIKIPVKKQSFSYKINLFVLACYAWTALILSALTFSGHYSFGSRGEVMLSNQRPTLLVVDDSAITRKMIMTALRPLNPVFREASSGLEALEQIMLGKYDAITLDLNMPDIHGLEFLQFVRNQKTFQNIPIIVISTQSDEHMRGVVLSAGANVFIPKPFTPQHILHAVKAVLISNS